ncbi:MAG TPA: glycosyltransferase [Flavilitoribacter sp.]|nr:glycosyltransferase [Flavilitoribacter sp.]HMQ87848.1 glycosyltransferase [Flavilitoribacter sp.]
MPAGKRILIAVLDWGLGHAARCVPLVRVCRELGAEPVVAGSGRALALLKLECPEVSAVELPAYGIRYPYRNMYLNMAFQGGRIVSAVRREHRQTRSIVREMKIDAIISDCRFGCYHAGIPSVLINHQVRLPVKGFAGKIAGVILKRWTDRFRETWVPDQLGPGTLSGALSGGGVPDKVRFIGRLSRMEPVVGPLKYDVVALLSGPEPQRTKLEALLLPQLERVNGRTMLVRGLPGNPATPLQTDRVEVVDHLEGPALNAALAGAGLIVCRSGYSTLMDLSALGSRAVLIPTPGQGEQEYLGERCRRMGWAGSYAQHNFDLSIAMDCADDFTGFPQSKEDNSALLRAALQSLFDA